MARGSMADVKVERQARFGRYRDGDPARPPHDGERAKSLGGRFDDLGLYLGAWISRGAIAGLVAGWGFILANMLYADANGQPAIAPLLAISTIFYGTDQPQASPENAIVGLTLHLGLSLGFGIGFGLIAALLPNLRAIVVASVVYGLLLYVLNFQILGRTAFPFFTDPMGPSQGFEVWIHAVFGLLLAPMFFFGLPGRLRSGRSAQQ